MARQWTKRKNEVTEVTEVKEVKEVKNEVKEDIN
jgi:hypothetical protein